MIVLAIALRIVLTIALMAILYRLVLGHDVGAAPVKVDAAIGSLDAALLIGCAGIGMPLGTLLRLPAPTCLGPLILSAAVHMAGRTASVPPSLPVNAAQVALGTIQGCRFLGILVDTLARAGVLNLGATLITLALAPGGALAMQHLAVERLDQGILALAPGGPPRTGRSLARCLRLLSGKQAEGGPRRNLRLETSQGRLSALCKAVRPAVVVGPAQLWPD
ncbi:MAG: AbrB family transcriptional regulator [Rhodobacterales bacterium]|nr:AbrB family transcriptional regulator [Rhodobacterales bacterium]